MTLEQKILSDITVFMKYAKFDPNKKRRETWTELIDRNKEMHLNKFPNLKNEIEEAYKLVYDKKVLPSMRSLQFAGRPVEIGNQRMYNCCYFPINHYKAFSEGLFLLLSGCFSSDTEILTKDGIKKIKDVLISDFILTYDEKTDSYEWVNPTFAGKTISAHKPKIELVFDDGTIIKCTEDHEFFTENRGWVEARDLENSDKLVHQPNSNFQTLGIRTKIQITDPIDYYDLTVPVTHNFCLANGSVVHNCGVGYSIQHHHVDQLDPIIKPTKTYRYVIEDSIAGWADAIKVLLKSYFSGKPKPRFDYRDIRPKGARLVTSGGKAPGPEPLKICLTHVESILESKQNGEKLTPIECHDIMCHLADAVLSGGIRRAAMIATFSFDDDEMLTCKYGNWWELHPQRARANNSAVVMRNEMTKEEFLKLWKKIELSNAGEPGISWSNDKEYGFNPCILGETKLLTNKGFIAIQKLTEIYKMNPDIRIITQNSTGVLAASTLEWCGITNKNDKIYKITFDNGKYQLVNLTHKFYLPDFTPITVLDIMNAVNTEIYLVGYKKNVKVVSVEDTNTVSDVYDLTASPNYNFFAICDDVETFSNHTIQINNISFFPFDVVTVDGVNIFAKDVKLGQIITT